MPEFEGTLLGGLMSNACRKNARILIAYPYGFLEGNPTMMLLVRSLAERGAEVDVLLEHGAPPKGTFSSAVRFFEMPFSALSPEAVSPAAYVKRHLLRTLRRAPAVGADPTVWAYSRARHYDAVVGVDPVGLAFAHALNERARKPLSYVSFELLFKHELLREEDRRLQRLEHAALADVSRVLIQDGERAQQLHRETGFPLDRMTNVPVAPVPARVPRTNYLRDKFGIPSNRRIVLYSGALTAWAGRDTFAEMVSYWPEQFCLVVHTWQKGDRPLSRELRELVQSGRLVLSTEALSPEELCRMVASADYGLAPYQPVGDGWASGDNLHYLGLASGKVAYYAMCGLPILARSLPTFEREFTDFDCGRIYRRLSETGALLKGMEQGYLSHSREARRFYETRLNPLPGMDQFCRQLLSLAGAEAPQTAEAAPVRVPQAEAA